MFLPNPMAGISSAQVTPIRSGCFSTFFYPVGRHSARFSRGDPRPRADHYVGQAKERVELMAVLGQSPTPRFPVPE